MPQTLDAGMYLGLATPIAEVIEPLGVWHLAI
jgi:hypothetical protein